MDPDSNVLVAVELGWTMADVFHTVQVHPRTDFERALSKQTASEGHGNTRHLVGYGDFSDASRLQIQFAALAERLAPKLAETFPELSKLVADLQASINKGATKEPGAGEAEADDPRLSSVEALHLRIVARLQATDPRAAVGYGLGRALSDTALMSTSSAIKAEPGERVACLARELEEHRVANLTRWLAVVAADLDAGIAEAVADSMRAWQRWAAAKPAGASNGAVSARFNQQAEVWKELLAGRAALDTFQTPAKSQAATRIAVSSAGRLAKGFIAAYWWAIVAITVVLTALTVVGLLGVSSTSKTLTVLGAGAAAVGVTWKTVGSSAVSITRAGSELFSEIRCRERAAFLALVPPPGCDDSQSLVRLRSDPSL